MLTTAHLKRGGVALATHHSVPPALSFSSTFIRFPARLGEDNIANFFN